MVCDINYSTLSESISMFCDEEVVLQKMKYPESCEGWADLIRHSKQIEFTNFPNGLQFEVRSEGDDLFNTF